MPRLSISDCEALLQALEMHPARSSDAQRATDRLRLRLEQAYVSRSSSQARPPEPPEGDGDGLRARRPRRDDLNQVPG